MGILKKYERFIFGKRSIAPTFEIFFGRIFSMPDKWLFRHR